jgi:hypothetical protein
MSMTMRLYALAELRNCELDGTACRAMKNERG